MNTPRSNFVAIACGGTGGHLFPGVAVAEKLLERGCDVTLFVSEKEVDRQAGVAMPGCEVVALPAMPLLVGQMGSFLRAFWTSFVQARAYFKRRPAGAVLAMGGFTSAPPILAGRVTGAATSLHESNSFAGRANRLLAPWVDRVFIGYSSATQQLSNRAVQFTGTPVRSQFQPADPGACRMALGLKPEAPVLLVMGGSQGASAINNAVIETLPAMAQAIPGLQVLHLTGAATYEAISARYRAGGATAKVLPFLTEMEMALGAATVAISRAGASSIAELAAMRVPSILIPYPTAADNHQYFNARALAQQGAARMLIQAQLQPLASTVIELATDPFVRQRMQIELEKWHFPQAADQIVDSVFDSMRPRRNPAPQSSVLKLIPG